MQRNSLKRNQVLTPGSLPNKCGTKKKIIEFAKQKSLQSRLTCSTTCIPDYVKSCKENIMSCSYVHKTG